MTSDEEMNTHEEITSAQERRIRKKTDEVWRDFDEFTNAQDEPKAVCKKCKAVLITK